MLGPCLVASRRPGLSLVALRRPGLSLVALGVLGLARDSPNPLRRNGSRDFHKKFPHLKACLALALPADGP